MSTDIRNVKDLNGLIAYFADKLQWNIDLDDFDDIEDIAYDFDAEDIGLKEEAFARIKTLLQLPPLVDGQKWGIFCVEFDSRHFEVTALRKILSGLIPKRRNAADHAVWEQKDLLFLCFWGRDNDRTVGIAHFEDKESGLPTIKMISCAPAIEDFTQIRIFEDRLKSLKWPMNYLDHAKWQEDWSSAFTTGYKETIQNAATLTARLAIEAQGIRNRILDILKVETANGYVHLLYEKFKDTLIHDMTETQFADMYAQTVVYGLFSARCMDDTQDDFSASEAVDCIPNTNPFLKSLMQECLGAQNTGKLSFDELEIGNVVELLLRTKTDSIIQDFNRQTGGGKEDPVIHFYEEFLTAYDKQQKVQRGVYYTPQPVVNFIVRAVDSIIKTEFGLEDGLASTATKKIKYMREAKKRTAGKITKGMVEDTKEVPAIQILDPATGTGTFIRQTILQIYENFKQKNKEMRKELLHDAWNEYVPKHLLPRINAFEIMMAPYAVAHMKLAMILKDTGYDFKSDKRLNVFLTNTLEEAGNSDNQISLWSDPLAMESIAANGVKKDKCINVVIGNPPYAGASSNKNSWIIKLMEDYKKEPGGGEKLKEKNSKWINDDYVKFIRYGQKVISDEKNGIIAYICPHGFLDNPTFRGMRWILTSFFTEIYIVELHGDARRKEKSPDGSKDENVFDIQQGVCIFLGIRNTSVQKKCKVFRKDIYGSRNTKYEWLLQNSIKEIDWESLTIVPPYFFFANRQVNDNSGYSHGFSTADLFAINSMGVTTARDNIVIDYEYDALKNRFERIADPNISDEIIAEELFPGKIEKANIGGKSAGWSLTRARNSLFNQEISTLIVPVSYRPFDKRYLLYSNEWIERPRTDVMVNFIGKENYGLCLIKINRDEVCTALISDGITDKTVLSSKDNANIFPLYIYDDNNFVSSKKANFTNSILKKIESSIGLQMKITEREQRSKFFSPINLLDYIYAILYSPSYRAAYLDELRSEFPRIPYPDKIDVFWKYVDCGKRLREVHTLRSDEIDEKKYPFCGEGNNMVKKAIFKDCKIYINSEQYFDNIDSYLWDEYVGAYQPLQKWMKDMKSEIISTSRIKHYQKMISAMELTHQIMIEIDGIYHF